MRFYRVFSRKMALFIIILFIIHCPKKDSIIHYHIIHYSLFITQRKMALFIKKLLIINYLIH